MTGLRKDLVTGAALGIGVLAAGKAMRRSSLKGAFRGQTAVVTGGSRGLGFILARQLTRAGARVIIAARNERELSIARARIEGWILSRACDVSDREQIRALARFVTQAFGKIDLWINCAGIIQVGPLETMSERDFRQAMDINYWGAHYGTLEALSIMRRQAHGGRIMNISSIGGSVPVPHLAPYIAAKFALAGFSQAAAIEARKHQVSITTVYPGLMRTGSFLNASFKGNRGSELAWFSSGATIPGPSMNAERAAAQMLAAAWSRQPVITVGAPAKLLRVLHQLAPNLSIRIASWADRALPHAPEGQSEALPEPGWLHRDQSVFTRIFSLIGSRDATRWNQRNSVERAAS